MDDAIIALMADWSASAIEIMREVGLTPEEIAEAILTD